MTTPLTGEERGRRIKQYASAPERLREALASVPAEAMKWHILAKAGGRSDAWLDDFVARLPSAAQKEGEARARDFKPG